MKIYYILIFIVISFDYSFAKESITLNLKSDKNCQNTNSVIWLINSDKVDSYDIFLYRNCDGSIFQFSLIDKSKTDLNKDMLAVPIYVKDNLQDFLFNIFDPIENKNVCRLYFDSQLNKAVLEDFSGSSDNGTTIDEADNYFYFRQVGHFITASKRSDFEIRNLILCNIEGIVLYNYQEPAGINEFYFDMRNEPTGLYLFRLMTADKLYTKKLIYLK